MLRKRDSLQEEKLRSFLRMKRKKMGLSQVELSEMCNLPRSFVSKYEPGERFLTFTKVLLICKVLEIDPVEITKEVSKIGQNY